MTKLRIDLRSQTDKDFDPELVADLLRSVLRSVGIKLVSAEFIKVAEVTIFTSRKRPTPPSV